MTGSVGVPGATSGRPVPSPGLARIVVAVDGPSGAGKSSVSRGVALALGLRYLDTGSMYRAITWWMLEAGVDVQDPDAVAAAVDAPKVEAGTDPAAPAITVDGRDVAVQIRTDDVTAAVSAVSAVPAVRSRLLGIQRDAIGAGGIVVEGRDIGTAVAPDAAVKVFLTASEEARATRRAAEHSAADPEVTRVAQRTRDHLDSSRTVSPLRRADDAIDVDATELSLDEVVATVVALVRAHLADTGSAPPGQR